MENTDKAPNTSQALTLNPVTNSLPEKRWTAPYVAAIHPQGSIALSKIAYFQSQNSLELLSKSSTPKPLLPRSTSSSLLDEPAKTHSEKEQLRSQAKSTSPSSLGK